MAKPLPAAGGIALAMDKSVPIKESHRMLGFYVKAPMSIHNGFSSLLVV
jgi:hypothetical protein